MFAIRETMPSGGKRVVRTFATFNEARAVAVRDFDLAMIEDDDDFPGEAADALTKGGVVLAIERV